MTFVDYYKVLGVVKTATEKEIKQAYRKLARKHHPDLNPNDKSAQKKFQEINEANEVLSDIENRKKYDKYGKDWKHGEEFEKANQQQQSQRNSQSQNQHDSFSEHDFSDYFQSMFGGAGRSSRQETRSFKGQDFNAELHLELKDVYESQQQIITVNNTKIRLTIPAGIENGQTIKITGKGAKGQNGGPNGDLFITFSIQNHTQFKRDGNNLYTTVDLDLYTALLGGEATIETFSGKVKLKIAPETPNDTKVKLKGKGFPVYKKEGQFGDLIVTFRLKIPQNLSAKEKELIGELKNLR
jgi:curved DNA-binding protein